MAVVFVVLLSFEYAATYLAGYIVFTFAAITDYYDGKIARERNLVTNFGKLLDPVADKVLMMAAFLMLLQIDVLLIPAWTIIAILARELLITGARSLAAAEGEVLAAIGTGKAKTVLQMVYVFVFLLVAIVLQALQEYPALAASVPGNPGAYVDALGLVSRLSIILVALYTLYSGVDFARANWHILRLDKTS
jgi:CDP-diacylglycerol--glycerol-3-phosphate 3-phosphatidyltransferase